MDAALVLEYYITDAVANLPAEVQHLMEEIRSKDEVSYETRRRMAARDSSIFKHIRANGSLVPMPKEVSVYAKQESDFEKSISISNEKIELAQRSYSLITRHLNKIENEIKKLQNEGLLLPIDEKDEANKNLTYRLHAPDPESLLDKSKSSSPNQSFFDDNSPSSTDNHSISLSSHSHTKFGDSSKRSSPSLSNKEHSSAARSGRHRTGSYPLESSRIKKPPLSKTSSSLAHSSLNPSSNLLDKSNHTRSSSATPSSFHSRQKKSSLSSTDLNLKIRNPHKNIESSVEVDENSIVNSDKGRKLPINPSQDSSFPNRRPGFDVNGNIIPSSIATHNNYGSNLTTASGGNSIPDDEEDGNDTQLYCFCQQVSYGDMVACDNPNCKYEWFHYGCVGLKSPPVGLWYCSTCTAMRDADSKNKK